MQNRTKIEIQPRAFRVRDACHAIGLSHSTIYRLARSGKLRLVRIGGRTLVPASEIDRLTAEGSATVSGGSDGA